MQRCVMATGAERLMQTVQAAARKPKFRVICGFFGPVRDWVSCFLLKYLYQLYAGTNTRIFCSHSNKYYGGPGGRAM